MSHTATLPVNVENAAREVAGKMIALAQTLRHYDGASLGEIEQAMLAVGIDRLSGALKPSS